MYRAAPDTSEECEQPQQSQQPQQQFVESLIHGCIGGGGGGGGGKDEKDSLEETAPIIDDGGGEFATIRPKSVPLMGELGVKKKRGRKKKNGPSWSSFKLKELKIVSQEQGLHNQFKNYILPAKDDFARTHRPQGEDSFFMSPIAEGTSAKSDKGRMRGFMPKIGGNGANDTCFMGKILLPATMAARALQNLLHKIDIVAQDDTTWEIAVFSDQAMTTPVNGLSVNLQSYGLRGRNGQIQKSRFRPFYTVRSGVFLRIRKYTPLLPTTTPRRYYRYRYCC